MTDELRAVLARHLTGGPWSVVALGEGRENAAFLVDGELVVRHRKETDPRRRADAVRREHELLAIVRELSPLPVPEIAFADPEAGMLAYPRLDGVPLLGRPVARPAALGRALGPLFSALHGAPVERMARLAPRDAEPLGVSLADAREHFDAIAARLPAATRASAERFLAAAPPAEARALAFCHNDLGAEHILVDPVTEDISGILDWSDAAIADPAYDLALVLRDLGRVAFATTLEHYDGDRGTATRERAAFHATCAALEDIAYGLETGDRRHADAGLAHLARALG